MAIPYRSVIVVGLLALIPALASAQSSEPQRYVTFSGGVNAEDADDITGRSAGIGAGFGVRFARHWATEITVWVPGQIRSGPREFGRQHRDILVDGAVIRSFDVGRTQPFALLGLSVGRTQDRFINCIAMRPRFDTGEVVPMLISCQEPDVIRREDERFDSYSLFAVTGGGVNIPLTPRVSLVPEVRFDLTLGSVIARPSVGVKIMF